MKTTWFIQDLLHKIIVYHKRDSEFWRFRGMRAIRNSRVFPRNHAKYNIFYPKNQVMQILKKLRYSVLVTWIKCSINFCRLQTVLFSQIRCVYFDLSRKNIVLNVQWENKQSNMLHTCITSEKKITRHILFKLTEKMISNHFWKFHEHMLWLKSRISFQKDLSSFCNGIRPTNFKNASYCLKKIYICSLLKKQNALLWQVLEIPIFVAFFFKLIFLYSLWNSTY